MIYTKEYAVISAQIRHAKKCQNYFPYSVFTDKSIRLLGKNQYTFNVESGLTRTKIKHWVEHFFGVKVIAMNSHWLSGKGRRMRPIMGHTMHCKCIGVKQTSYI